MALHYRDLLLIMLVLASSCSLSGCGRRAKGSPAVGHYKAAGVTRDEHLIVYANGTFKQWATKDGATLFRVSGKWEVADKWLHFDALHVDNPVAGSTTYGPFSTNSYRDGVITVMDDVGYRFEWVGSAEDD